MNPLVPELLAAVGPRVRTSPYFDCTVRAGLTAVSTYNHMWLPMSFGDLDAEYERLTKGVSMWDVAAQRHIEVAGDDADLVIQTMTVIDASAVERGTAAYAPMVDHDGRLVNDPILIRLDDGTWRFSIADSDVRLWIDATARHRGLACTVRELDTATLAVQGPKSADVMDALGLGSCHDLDDMAHLRTTVAGYDVIVSRSGWSTQGGFEFFLDDSDGAEDLWKEVEAAGRDAGIGPGAPNAQERIENVLLSYGTDSGYDADPFELGLGDLIDFAHDFVGRDALQRIADRGPERKLVGALLDGDRMDVVSRPVPMSIDGDDIGMLRAGAWSPKFGRNLGLALIDAGVDLDDAARAHVLSESDPRTARLVPLPFDDVADLDD